MPRRAQPRRDGSFYQSGVPAQPGSHGQVQPDRLSGIDVERFVQRADADRYPGHSQRAGHPTTAAIVGASERSIMNQTGHRSVQMVRRYIREGSPFPENSAGELGLLGFIG
jgi:hypothetical protein